MSHLRIKTEYNEEGAYGATEKHALYAHHNLSCDQVSFYNEKGECILTICDSVSNNLLDAINRLNFPHKDIHGTLNDNIQCMTAEDFKIVNI